MEENKKTGTKKVALFAIILVALAVALATVYFLTRPSTQAGAKTISVEVVAEEYGKNKTYTVDTDEEYLGPVLLRENIAQGESGQHGLFIQTAEGVTADDTKQEWWCITKGGESLETGADQTPIADGDSFELTLMTGW